jgi:Ni,Fe-hydrogenase I cytochrome b subunit
MFAWQYRFALSSASKLKTILHNPLLDATKGFLLFTALISVTTGFCAWSAEVTLFFVALLTAMVQEMQITKESEQLERKV